MMLREDRAAQRSVALRQDKAVQCRRAKVHKLRVAQQG